MSLRIAGHILLGIILGIGVSLLTMYVVQPAPPKPPSEGGELVARVGNVRVTRDQFMRAVQQRRRNGRQSADFDEVLNALIEDAAVENYALDRGFLEKAENQLAWRRFLAHRVRERELVPKLEGSTPTDEACKTYYENHPEAFTKPEKRRLALLRLTGSNVMSERQKARQCQRMEDAREAIAAFPEHTRDFGKLAIEYSDHQPSRYRGGDVGWVINGPHAIWPESVIEQGFALSRPGDVTDVMKANGTLYLVRLTDIQPAGRKPFETVRDRIRVLLLKQNREKCRSEFMQRVLSDTPIVRFPQKIPKPDTSPSGSVQRPPLPPNLPPAGE